MKSIKLTNITKTYNNSVKALNNISLTLNQGEFIVVMGQSGSGKSTLLQIAGLLDTPTIGTVEINGKNVSTLCSKELADVRRDSLGFVFQAFHLNPHLKLYENVMVPMLINDSYSGRKQMKRRSLELIEGVGLSHRVEHYPSELSGGEQQRVAIARALANNPDFILADEPTGNLDSKNEQMIFESLRELSCNGRGVLAVCHNDAVRDFADRILIMKDGELRDEKA